MLGLGTVAFLAALGVSGTKCAIENYQMMKEPVRYLSDGTPVYIDRLCQQHINGERVILKWTHDLNGGIKLIEVGERTGRIYNDPEVNTFNRMNRNSEENKRKAIAEGYPTYEKYDFEKGCSISCEVSTGRYISQVLAKLENGKEKFYKFYLPSGFKNLSDTVPGDTGIEITKEEYWNFKICGGTFFLYDARPGYMRHN